MKNKINNFLDIDSQCILIIRCNGLSNKELYVSEKFSGKFLSIEKTCNFILLWLMGSNK